VINYIFGVPVYLSKVEDHINFDDYIEKSIQNDLVDSCDDPNNDWNCKLKTTYRVYNKPDYVKPFVNGIQSLIYDYLDFFEYSKEQYELSWEYPWINYYERGDHQEVHRHVPAHFSYAYLHKSPKKIDDSFHFVNESLTSNFAYYPRTNFYNEYFKIDLHEKHILVFPSFFSHFVVQNVSDNPRVTVSGNITLIPKELNK
jgi:hypothetical protein